MADKLIKLFRETQRVILALADAVDQSFLGVVTKLAPILAPIPAAYSVYRAMIAVGAGFEISLATAGAIEIIGMFQSKTALRARNWNLVKLKSEPAAPFGLALTMAAIYFLTAFGLTMAIEFWPDKGRLVFPAFVVFAASVYVSNALASDLSRWETDRDDRLRGQQVRSGLAAEVRELTGQANKLRSEVKRLTSDLTTRGQELVRLTDQIGLTKLTLTGLTAKSQEMVNLTDQIGQARLTLASLTDQADQLKLTLSRETVGNNTIDQCEKCHNKYCHDLSEENGSLKLASQVRQDNVTDRRLRLIDLLNDNPDLTNQELANLLEVSLSTVKGDKRALNGRLAR